jgi:hypothetical protein
VCEPALDKIAHMSRWGNHAIGIYETGQANTGLILGGEMTTVTSRPDRNGTEQIAQLGVIGTGVEITAVRLVRNRRYGRTVEADENVARAGMKMQAVAACSHRT